MQERKRWLRKLLVGWKKLRKLLLVILILSFLLLTSGCSDRIDSWVEKVVSLTRKGRQRPLPEPNKPLAEICRELGIVLPFKSPLIVVNKSQRKLFLYEGETFLKCYPVSLGKNPAGQKEREGDKKTPEGNFYICQKVENPKKELLGSRWMRISYPNEEAAERGLKNGLITEEEYRRIVRALLRKETPPQKTPLGGGIGIHGGNGLHFKADWTEGCIGMYDEDIEEFYDFIPLGTPVKIIP